MSRLWSSGSGTAHGRHPSAPCGDHLSTQSEQSTPLFQRAHPLPARTFSVPTITDGYARAWWPQHLFALPLRRPDCTLSRLRAEEYDQPVTQSTPEPSSRTIPTLDQVLVSCKSLECVTTPESSRSCPG